MANVVQIKRSDTASVVPAAGELAHGELAVNLADGILFSKDGSGNIKKIGGDAYDLNTTAATSGTGGKITLNRTSSGTSIADGVVEIIGSDTVTVTRSGTGTAGVLTLSSGGGTLTDLTADAYDDGTKVEPNNGTIAILGGTGIGTVGSDSNDRITINIDSTVTTLTGTQTLTNKTLTAPIVNGAGIIFEGATADDFETTLAVTDPTADRTITLPNVTGTVVTTGDTGSVTNTMLAGSIANGKLVNDGITIGSTDTSLGDTITTLVGMNAITASGAITGGSLVADNTTINNSTITDTGANFKIDASGSINLDAAGSGAVGTVSFADAGLNYALFLPSASDDLLIRPAQTDKDIILQGNDDGSVIDMLKLDASDAGNATFSGSITSTAGDVTITAGDLNISKSASEQAEINLFEATGAGTNKITIKPHLANLTSDTTITLPAENGIVITTGSSNIVNANISGSAAIADSKLAKITTADKVGGESIDITSATDGNSITVVDADQILLDDGGTTKRVLASQIKTYIDGGSGGINIDRIDVDGGTDLAAPALGDEIIVADTSDSGNTKKADIGSVLDLISGDVEVDGSGVATIQPNSVALGTDTTGNFVATLADAGNDFTISNSGAENAGVTIGLGNSDGDISVTRDVSIGRNLTATAATAITLGAGTSTVTIGDDLDVTGDLEVTGDLTVNGTTTTVNTTNLVVEDPIIQLAKGNSSGDTVDIGFFGEYRSSESGNPQRHAGLVRDASATTWNGTTQKGGFILFSESTDVPTTTFNHTNATAFQYGALAVGHLAFGTTGGAITAATTPHIEASGGIDLSSSGSNAQKYTDGINAPGELHFMTTRNCIIDCGSFDGSA